MRPGIGSYHEQSAATVELISEDETVVCPICKTQFSRCQVCLENGTRETDCCCCSDACADVIMMNILRKVPGGEPTDG